MIVLAFDSFKGCISAEEACQVAAEAIQQALPEAEVIQLPLSDGGEGLVHSVLQTFGHKKNLPQIVRCKVHDPLMNLIEAEYAIDPDGKTAYMEMAASSGLPLVPPDKRNPMFTTTYGVGDMIIDALDKGIREIVMGIGGSATCDGGQGMIECLSSHGLLSPHPTGALAECHITVACDVTNPLYGPQGAAYIFAPQKGASPEQVKILDQRLQDFARRTEATGIADCSLADYPGTGAAGGLGYALMAYLKAELRSGIETMLSIVHFDERINGASLIITGEGKSDNQTLMGKVPHGVLRHAQSIPVWLLSGAIDDTTGALSQHFSLVKSINEGDRRPLEVLMQPTTAKENLKNTVASELQSRRLSQTKDFLHELS